MAELLKGAPVAAAMTDKLRPRAEKLAEQGVHATLAVVRVGATPDALSYERGIMRRFDSIGIAVKPFLFPDLVSREELLEAIYSINKDSSIHGCLIFRPLPRHLDEIEICESLSPAKDVDGITSASLAGLFTNRGVGFPPCTAKACIELLDHYHIPIAGKTAAVVGRSLVVGRPLSMLLLHRNATVTLCHTGTVDLPKICSNVDILVASAGKANMLDASYTSKNQVVLDVGINIAPDGKLCGDVDFSSVSPVVGYISPVPGGIGAITTAVLASHVIEAAEHAAWNI